MTALLHRALLLALLSTPVFAGSAVAGPATPAQDMGVSATAQKPTPADFGKDMRKLWEDHITYTRNYIISALAGLPDATTIATRLLANQDDIGDAIAPYYGQAAGDALAALLRAHIVIATEVVEAAQSGDADALADAQARWSANGREIAAFLAGANPNWSQAELEAALQRHLDLTTGEVVGRLQQDWAADIAAYDAGHEHMLMFADTLSDGIVAQFPSRFRGGG